VTAQPEPGRRYHYVLTESFPDPGGVQYATNTGTLIPDPGVTRTAVLQHLREQMRAANGWLRYGNVLFFSFEPDDLTAS
jgi:hypothetical protein